MPVHLGLDIAGGLVLAAAPWVFDFSEQARLPYLAIGIFEIVVSLVSQTVPGQQGEPAAGRSA
jgi:hypothetical protein